MTFLRTRYRWLVVAVVLAVSGWLWSEQRFPPPDFESPYTLRPMDNPPPTAPWEDAATVGVLLLALSLATWIALKLRSRNWMVVLSVGCLVYFGFIRGGCVCPIGAIQNITLGLFDSTYYVSWSVIALFAIPLVFALLVGRVFCGGVCPLGAIQDLVLIRPVRVPTWLQRSLGTLPWVYLGAAVLFAATDTMFIICRYDPFVSFFRLAGSFGMLTSGGVVLVLSTFVGRPYCRFVCPYGALLGLLSRVSFKGVTITPDECVACGLCEDACPFGAIEPANTAKEDAE